MRGISDLLFFSTASPLKSGKLDSFAIFYFSIKWKNIPDFGFFETYKKANRLIMKLLCCWHCVGYHTRTTILRIMKTIINSPDVICYSSPASGKRKQNYNLFNFLKKEVTSFLRKVLSHNKFTLIIFCFFISNTFAQIAQRGTSTSTSGGGTSLVITKPTGVVIGDVLLASFSLYDGTGVNSASYNPSCAGWTLIDGRILSGSAQRRSVLLYKVATSSEGSNYTFSYSSASFAVGQITAFSGADVTGATPFDVAPGTISTGVVSTNTVSATSITTLTANSAVLLFGFEVYNGYSFSSWSNTSPGAIAMTELVDAKYTNWASVGLSWGTKASAGVTGTGTFVLSGSSTTSYWGAIQIALKRNVPCSATTYYSKSTGNLELTSSWSSTTDGTGCSPANFTTAGVIYIIQQNLAGNATRTIGANWTVSGGSGATLSKVVLGQASAAAVTFTVPSGFSFTGTIDVPAALSLSNTLVLNNTTVPTLGTLHSGSTVKYNATGSQTIQAATYGNLETGVVSGTSNSTKTVAASGTLTIAGNLTINEYSTFNLNDRDMTLTGDFIRTSAASPTTSLFSHGSGTSNTVTFNGSSQEVNVTAANGTTPTNGDITFNHVVIDGASVKLFYFKTNDRKININNFTVNSGKVVTLYSNPQ